MKNFGEQLSNEQRELLIELYVEGLDESDAQKVEKVLQYALRDEVLEIRIDEINSFYAQCLGFDELTQTVVKLADEHLQTRFDESEFEEKVLTFGDVAKQMDAKNRVPTDDAENNSQIIKSNIPLPEYLSLPEIKRIANQLKIKASERFWSLFRKEAIFLTMRQSQKQAAFATRAKRLQKKK